MTRLQKIAKLYSIAIAEYQGWDIITERDIFAIMRNIKNAWMLPNQYQVEMPPPHVYNIYGPTIIFSYKGNSPQGEFDYNIGKGDNKLIQLTENKLKETLSNIISTISTKYEGNGVYTVTITQPA